MKNQSRRKFIKKAVKIAGLTTVASTTSLANSYAHKTIMGDGLPKLPSYVSWKNKDALHVHSWGTIETHRKSLGDSVITPNELVYVRNNMPSMKVNEVGNIDKWQLKLEGVRSPRIFELSDLKKFKRSKLVTVLQCSGNGRGFYPHRPRGTQWETGAAACIEWTGVFVKDLINYCGGLSIKAKFMTSTGGEKVPIGMPRENMTVERSQPISVIKNSMIAWEMNGVPLPLAHGGPLRTIIPGYAGINNVKHVKKISFTEKESSFKMMRTSYRVSPHGKKGPQYPSCWEMPVKSWITSHSNDENTVKAGTIKIMGLALGGMHVVKSVKVSINGGDNWVKAKFVGKNYGKFSWRKFEIELNLSPGKYNLASKARNSRFQSQPMDRLENERGYLNNSWVDHSINITVV